MKRPVRIFLADDHLLVRAGIRSLLEQIEGVEIVGEAADGHETMRLVEKQSPDILLLDVALPGLNGLEVARRLLRNRPELRVVILSMHATEDYVQQALQAGAVGYVLKEATVAELELAIRAVSERGMYLSPSVSRQVVGEYVRGTEKKATPAERLTPRQREVLQLLAEGHSTKEIAFRLGLSVKTVETHRARLMERLGIRDLAGLVRYAVRTGVVPPDA